MRHCVRRRRLDPVDLPREESGGAGVGLRQRQEDDPAERAKQAWAAFAADPSGSGPFRVTRFVPRERLELAANREYWDEKRRPKIDRVVL
ncbi:MAG TPA: ABC transporter substrate-binding protein, partial [Beijerinckiaceae bacterium]|nr:ABC transporter substrate-binding protein [Beijerinckiaceae bacterium]